MRVLIAIHHRVQAWTIDDAHVEELRRRFPHVTFMHSTARDTDIDLAETVDAAFALGLPTEAIARATRLQWLHCSGHAVGHFPLADLAARSILVTNSRGVQAIPIAEHVMACILALARRLPQTMRDQQESLWRPNELLGDSSPWLLSGRTLAIIGA